MNEKIVELLACPVCREPLFFEGEKMADRLLSGRFTCDHHHTYQVREEIGILKDAKLSANEFEWKVDVACEGKYDEIRKQYDSYLRDDQKAAARRIVQRLVDLVSASIREPDDAVLDVATGMGTFILPLVTQASRDMMLIGTDVDEKPLRGVMTKAKKVSTWHKMSLAVVDAKHLAFKDNSLSTISSHFGFDSIPETVLAFKESARVLRAGGCMFFSSLWLREESESMRLAEKYKVCQIGSKNRLSNVLSQTGLTLESVEEIHRGVWPHNPMDLLPVEGDEYQHVVVEVRKASR